MLLLAVSKLKVGLGDCSWCTVWQRKKYTISANYITFDNDTDNDVNDDDKFNDNSNR